MTQHITGTLKIQEFPGNNTVVTKVWNVTKSDKMSGMGDAFDVGNSREPDEIHVRTLGEEVFE